MDEEMKKGTLIILTEEGLKQRLQRLHGLVYIYILGMLFIGGLLILLGFTASDAYPLFGMPGLFYVSLLGGIIFACVGLVLANEWKLIVNEYAKLAVIKGEVEVPEE
jgi:uncharacterized membrane protein YoaT (DUF817 family)